MVQHRYNKQSKLGAAVLGEGYRKGVVILHQYDHTHDLIFLDLQGTGLTDKHATQRRISFATGRVDKVAQAAHQLTDGHHQGTEHIARHTFSNISGEKIPVQMLQKLYRHSNIQMTIAYQAHFMTKNADDALDAVLKF